MLLKNSPVKKRPAPGKSTNTYQGVTNKARYFLPAFIWGVIIFLIISLPTGALPATDKLHIPHFDKIVHFTMYFAFGAFIVLGFGKYKRATSITSKHIIISLVAGVFYGVITEYLQHCCFADRNGNIYDALANGFGTVFGVFMIVILNKISK
jgi:VanZ family protein